MVRQKNPESYYNFYSPTCSHGFSLHKLAFEFPFLVRASNLEIKKQTAYGLTSRA